MGVRSNPSWWKGGGIYSGSKNGSARRFWTRLPLTLTLHATCVTHVLSSGDSGGSWLIQSWESELFEREAPKNLIVKILKFPFANSSAV